VLTHWLTATNVSQIVPALTAKSVAIDEKPSRGTFEQLGAVLPRAETDLANQPNTRQTPPSSLSAARSIRKGLCHLRIVLRPVPRANQHRGRTRPHRHSVQRGEIEPRPRWRWRGRTTHGRLPLASFTESSDFSVCSYPWVRYWPFPSPVRVSGPS
jgi:hypothetical protein